MEVLGYISLFFVGIVLGAMGSGGSILSVPILVYLFAMEPVQASAYSLFVVGITSAVGAALKHGRTPVDAASLLLFGGPSAVAIFATRSWLVHLLPEQLGWDDWLISKRTLLLVVFALLMMVAAGLMLKGKRHQKKSGYRTERPWYYLLIVGLLAGSMSGFAGIGGGFIITAVLFYFSSLSFEQVLGTSLSIIAVNSFVGFAGDCINFPFDWTFLLSITTLAVLGIVAGSRLGVWCKGETAVRAFGWFVLLTGSCILVAELLG